MPFYTYFQNNSFGRWKQPGLFVIVEADNPEAADKAAEGLGLYWDYRDSDCRCCGLRWRCQWEDEEGTEKPEVYGELLADHEPWAHRLKDSREKGIPYFLVAHKDGTQFKYTPKDEAAVPKGWVQIEGGFECKA